nr:hypothetical protein [Tanacetum cinerariifolium]
MAFENADSSPRVELIPSKIKMLEVLDRQDVLDLHKIIMERFPANDPEGYNLILWGDLKTLVELSKDDEIWRNQQDWKLLSWKMHETCGVHTLIVHTLMMDDSLVSINMFVEKRLKKSKLFGYILLVIMKLILKKLNFYLVKIKFREGLLGFMLFGVSISSPINRASSARLKRRHLWCVCCEELQILLPKLIFSFPGELRTSPGVPSNLDDGNAALL